MASSEARKLIQESKARFVDFRFCDMRGKEQHVTTPASIVDEAFIEEGKMFDGSSIDGWKGINDSDMVLMPDAGSAALDPFFEEPTVIMRCDVLEPNTMLGYEPEEEKVVLTVAQSLEEALNCLSADRAFLKEGDVFSDDLIDGYINLKMEDVLRMKMSAHPAEFDLYYSC